MKEIDAELVYIKIRSSKLMKSNPIMTKEMGNGVNLDYNTNTNEIIGIEIIVPSTVLITQEEDND